MKANDPDIGSTRDLVDPELLPLLDIFPRIDYEQTPLSEIRSRTAEIIATMPRPDLTGVGCREVTFASQTGAPDIRALLMTPQDARKPLSVVLHIHGGGMVIGDPEMMIGQNAELVRRENVAILSVDYRLAPETKAPGNVEDCYAALAWLAQEARALGLDGDRIGIMGESAGGGIAASLALLVRDRGEYAIRFLILASPMLDNRTGADGTSTLPYGEFIWPPGSNRFGWKSLLGEKWYSDDHSPYCVPALATDLHGLPPTFMHVGSLDLFLRENIEFARKLADSRVQVELHVYPGAYHGFEVMAETRIARNARTHLCEALRRFVAD